MADQSKDERVSAFKNLLVTGDYSDLVITCGVDTYNVHKSIVCTQAGFFKKADKFPGKEAAENVVDLPEDDPTIIKLLMSYLYEGEYDPSLPKEPLLSTLATTGQWPLSIAKDSAFTYEFLHTCQRNSPITQRMVCPHHQCYFHNHQAGCIRFVCQICTAPGPLSGDANQLLLHSQMYAVADKYDIPGLSHLAQVKFARACDTHWDDEQLPIAMCHALTTTPDQDQGLRKTLHELLAQKPELLGKPAIETSVKRNAEFAFGIVKRQAKRLKSVETT